MPEPVLPIPESEQYAAAGPAKRCLRCYYVLDHLPTNVCPECGRPFDPFDSRTYTTKPPFVWWRFWLPGALLAAGLGLVAALMLLPFTGFGYAVTLAIPVMIGGVVGYRVRGVGIVGLWLTAALAFAAFLLGLGFGGTGGVFCAAILFGMAIVPLAVSVALGFALRVSLKGSRWGQRHWLPVLLLFLVPHVAAVVELRFPPPPVEVVETTREIDAPPAAAWDGVMFYEEVRHDPPWVLRLALRRPLYTAGSTAAVGDRKTCVYARGHLTKRVTERRPGELLAFDVVEQVQFEQYSVRLTRGSFRFEPIDGGRRTRVTLRTEYEPLLKPRLAWRPAEAHVAHLLHEHVMEGMAGEAKRRTKLLAAATATADGVGQAEKRP